MESANNISQPNLSSNLVSLTVNNGTGNLNLAEEKIKLTFMRPQPGVSSFFILPMNVALILFFLLKTFVKC